MQDDSHRQRGLLGGHTRLIAGAGLGSSVIPLGPRTSGHGRPFRVGRASSGREQLQAPLSEPQHLAGSGCCSTGSSLDRSLLRTQPARCAGPPLGPQGKKTPVLTAEEARAKLDAIDTTTPAGLRDRALIGLRIVRRGTRRSEKSVQASAYGFLRRVL